MKTGTVFKIQKYSIHDGPGIRTSVFLKGCPLSCWWCHNPESIKPVRELVFHEEKCLDCGRCINNCTEKVLAFETGKIKVKPEDCNTCGSCAAICPGKALEVIGKEMSVPEVMAAVSKDIIFYDESDGGVTFTGGEPTFQHEFLLELLKSCSGKGIHTAVDTSGYTSWARLEELSRFTNLFLFDLKMMDDEKHRKYTGVSNRLILENLQKLSAIHANINVRMPIITGINDDMENIVKTCSFLASLRIGKVNILPYHTIGINKYDKFGMNYKLRDTLPPDEEKIMQIKAELSKIGMTVKVGG